MKKKAEKWMCMLLSAVMCFGSPCMTAFAEEAEEAAEMPPMISFDKTFIELESSETPVETQLTLNSTSEIEGTIAAQDITLSGAFRDMTVENISHDENTVNLTLSGVPDLTREYQGLQPVGTLEISGAPFGTEEPLEAGVTILPQIETDEHAAPGFWPYFDAMIENEDTFEMHIVLLPASGEFSEEFSECDVSFDMDMKKAEITSFQKSEACCELIASVPKYKLAEGEETYSYTGSVILSEGSMVNAAGEVNEEEISVTRKFAPETTGRDLSMSDIDAIKGIVGGFGNTTLGTIGGILSGGATAYNAAWTVLGLCGVVPTDRSRHAEIMNKLDEIHNSVTEVNDNVLYCQNLLHSHTLMLRKLGVKMDTYYVAGFNTQMTGMISTMDKIERALQDPDNLPLIESAVEEVCAQYQVPAEGSDRDMDFDEVGDGSLGDGSYVEDIPGDEAAPAPVPEEYYDFTETEPSADTVEPADAVNGDFTDDLLTSETGDGDDLTGEPEEPEPVSIDQILQDYQMRRFQWALDEKLQAIHQSPRKTIGDLVQDLEEQYSKNVIGFFETEGDANPINAYINLHAQKDNFTTTSLAEKVLYAEEIKYQLARAVMLLEVLDGYSSHIEERKRLDNAFFPDPAEGAFSLDRDPWCYVMNSYVKLSGGEISAVYYPMKVTTKGNTPVRITILDEGKVMEFADRMGERTCAEELEKARFTASRMYAYTLFSEDALQKGVEWNKKYQKTNVQHAGLTFEYEVAGCKHGAKRFPMYIEGRYNTGGLLNDCSYLGTGWRRPCFPDNLMRWRDEEIVCFAIISRGFGWNDTGSTGNKGYSVDVTYCNYQQEFQTALENEGYKGWAPIYPKHFLFKVDYAGNKIDYDKYITYSSK